VKLENKVALVTGAGLGIGREIALTFAHEGASVVVTDINEELGNKVAVEIRHTGSKSIYLKADVSDYNQVQELVNASIREFGQIDILQNCAAISDKLSTAEEVKLQDWNKVLAVTLNGVFFCCQLVGREMIKRRTGSIINIASTAGVAALSDQIHYVAAKHGVVGITKALAVEWGRYGIRANCICPGLTETETTAVFIHDNPEYVKQRLTKIPLGRLGKTSDQAKVALFLASDDAGYVTGQIMVVDGGTFPLYAGYSPPPSEGGGLVK